MCTVTYTKPDGCDHGHVVTKVVEYHEELGIYCGDVKVVEEVEWERKRETEMESGRESVKEAETTELEQGRGRRRVLRRKPARQQLRQREERCSEEIREGDEKVEAQDVQATFEHTRNIDLQPLQPSYVENEVQGPDRVAQHEVDEPLSLALRSTSTTEAEVEDPETRRRRNARNSFSGLTYDEAMYDQTLYHVSRDIVGVLDDASGRPLINAFVGILRADADADAGAGLSLATRAGGTGSGVRLRVYRAADGGEVDWGAGLLDDIEEEDEEDAEAAEEDWRNRDLTVDAGVADDGTASFTNDSDVAGSSGESYTTAAEHTEMKLDRRGASTVGEASETGQESPRSQAGQELNEEGEGEDQDDEDDEVEECQDCVEIQMRRRRAMGLAA